MNFDAVFYPKSIAIVGASRRETHVGHGVLKNLIEQGYEGEIIPINPNAEEILGRVCYPTLTAAGKSIDLVIFTVHPEDVEVAMEEAAKVGVKAAIVITAGYKEVGEIDLERNLVGICNKNGITLVGPNCLGVINPSIKMNASFAGIMPRPGTVSFFSQSGALCVAILDYAEKLGIGFSKFVSMGNKAQVDERELMRFLLDDPETKVIAMYLEDLTHPHDIIDIISKAREEGKNKPIIALKAGRTNEGAGASASHTGALAGSDDAFNAFFSQAGIIRAEKVSELFDYIEVFSLNPISNGRRIGIVTNAGGPGVLATDEASIRGLFVNKLSQQIQATLSSFLPKSANMRNPVDVVGDADAIRYEKALDTLSESEEIDIILAVLTHQTMTEVGATAKAIVKTKNKTGKPVIACFMGGNSVKEGVDILHEGGVSMIEYPEEAANAASKLSLYGEYLKRKQPVKFVFDDIKRENVQSVLAEVVKKGKKALSEYEALQIFSAYGFPILKTEIAKTREEAIQKAEKIGKNIVMKIVSEDILHKSDAGGVRLNVFPENAGDEFDKIMHDVLDKKPEARIDGVLLEEMAEQNGFEIILGAKRDPALGEIIMAGFGGVYVEVLKDVAFGLAPITKDDAQRMIESLKAKKILAGVRGQEPLDVDVLVQLMGRLSALIVDFSEISEIDINPLKLFYRGNGACVLDARIIIS